MNQIVYKPIGYIQTPFQRPENMPIQPSAAEGTTGKVVLYHDFTAGLKDLEGFSHAYLIYHLHLSKGFSLQVIPFLDKKPRGLFATRAPKRPNPIGISIVQIERIENNVIHISNIDMVNNTPLLDIKPFIPNFDNPEKVKTGWFAKVSSNFPKRKSDNRFN